MNKQEVEKAEKSLEDSKFYISRYRTVCDALEDMRDGLKTFNFSEFPSLIEEIQRMANRMEAALETQKDWHRVYRRAKRLNGLFKYRKAEYDELVQAIEDKKAEFAEFLDNDGL